MPRRSWPLLSLATLILVVPACSRTEGFRHDVYPTTGEVLRAGKPVPNAFVRFHPADPKQVQVPAGQQGLPILLTTDTDAEGRFSLSSYLADDGVPAGDYTVTVLLDRPAVDVENSDARSGAVLRKPAPAPATYANPATSTLRATVKPDAENHFVFTLD